MVDGEHLLFAETPIEFARALILFAEDTSLAARLADSAHQLAGSSTGAGLVLV